MKFWMSFLIFIIVGFVLCVAVSPAATLVWGIIYTLALLVVSEVKSMNTKEGRRQLQREKKEEEEYVEYWGSTKYWEDQKKHK